MNSELRSFREAMESDEKDKWSEGLSKSLRISCVTRFGSSKNESLIKYWSKWTFKIKLNEQVEPVRYKARLVALGNQQRPGIDFDKTYSPVVKTRTTRTLLALAVERKWEVKHVDIVAAYFSADLKDETFISIPEGLIEFAETLRKKYPEIPSEQELQSGEWVCRVMKGMYGLHQSGLLWNEKMDRFLRKFGLTRVKSDPCVYFSKTRELIVTVYVDDLLLYGSRREINRIKRALAREFEVRDLGKLSHVQSIAVKCLPNSIAINQSNYVKELLSEFQMQNCKAAKTPLAPSEKFIKTSVGEELDYKEAARYRTLVGSLMYLATATRPDLAFAATYLSQFSSNPAKCHLQAAKHVLRYLQGMKNFGLTYKNESEPLTLFTDADWSSDANDRKSFSGYVIKWSSDARV